MYLKAVDKCMSDKNVKEDKELTKKEASLYKVVSQLVTFIDEMDKKKEEQN